MLNSSGLIEDAFVVLDVGHGNCAIINDGGNVVVFDAGPGASLLEFLEQQKISKVHSVLLSHADADHIGGLVGVISSGIAEIKSVHLNSDSLKATEAWDDLLFVLETNPAIKFQPSLTPSDTGRFDTANVEIEILAPGTTLASKGAGGQDTQGRTIGSNSISSVIRLRYNGKPFALLPGDLDRIGLDDLNRLLVCIESPIVVFPHHGGRPGTSDMAQFTSDFLECTKPKTLIFSIGRGRHSTPKSDIIEAVKSYDAKIWILCTQLSDHCAIDSPDSDSFDHLTHEVYGHGTSKCKSCGGSFVYAFKTEESYPVKEQHQSFVREHADSRLCQLKR